MSRQGRKEPIIGTDLGKELHRLVARLEKGYTMYIKIAQRWIIKQKKVQPRAPEKVESICSRREDQLLLNTSPQVTNVACSGKWCYIITPKSRGNSSVIIIT